MDIEVVGIGRRNDGFGVHAAFQLDVINSILHRDALHGLGHRDPDRSLPAGAVGGRGGNIGGTAGNTGDEAILIHRGNIAVGAREGHILDGGVLRKHVPHQLRCGSDRQGNRRAAEDDLLDLLDHLNRHGSRYRRIPLGRNHDFAFAAFDALDLTGGRDRGDSRIRGRKYDAALVCIGRFDGRMKVGLLAGRQHQVRFPDGDARRALRNRDLNAAGDPGAVRRLCNNRRASLCDAGNLPGRIDRGNIRIPAGPFNRLDRCVGRGNGNLQGNGSPVGNGLSLRCGKGQPCNRLDNEDMPEFLDFRIQIAGHGKQALPCLNRLYSFAPDPEHPVVG